MKDDYTSAVWHVSEALALVEHWTNGEQLWSLLTVNKEHVCQITGETIVAGAEAFAPITHDDNRDDRISMDGMIKLVGETE